MRLVNLLVLLCSAVLASIAGATHPTSHDPSRRLLGGRRDRRLMDTKGLVLSEDDDRRRHLMDTKGIVMSEDKDRRRHLMQRRRGIVMSERKIGRHLMQRGKKGLVISERSKP